MIKLLLILILVTLVVVAFIVVTALHEIRNAIVLQTAHPMPVDPVAQAIAGHISSRNLADQQMGVYKQSEDDHVG